MLRKDCDTPSSVSDKLARVAGEQRHGLKEAEQKRSNQVTPDDWAAGWGGLVGGRERSPVR